MKSFNTPRRSSWVLASALLAAAPGLTQCGTQPDLSEADAPSSSQQRTFELGTLNVLTRSYDNQRSGANLSEKVLNHANVNSRQFGKLFQLPVDDEIYAQILYASGVSIGGVSRNVIYVATVNNTVYAFDAESAGAPLWQRNFNGNGRPPRYYEVANGSACNGNYHDFAGNIGIVGTPVIDATSSTMFFVTRTLESEKIIYRLHAVDIATGTERAASPKQITASVPGTGDGSDGTNIVFDPMYHNQRAGLALAANAVYVTFAAYCDAQPVHGWIMGYDVATLAQTGVFNTTANGSLGGIWQAGSAPAVDASGNIYVTTGNGDYDGAVNFGETLLKLKPRTLSFLSSFTPSNFATLNAVDDDFGSAGPSFVPGTNLIVNGGKEGKVYLLNSSNLGGMVPGDTQIPQSFQAVDTAARPGESHHIHNHNVVWNSPAGVNMYVWGENDYLRAYRFDPTTQRFSRPAARVGAVLPPPGMPGGTMSLSASGNSAGTGILWATTPSQGNANQASVPAILRAFNAETLDLLWDSSSPGDDPLALSKGSPPLIANGKVYLASVSRVVSVFGPRSGPTPPVLGGIYQVQTRTTSGKCLDIARASLSNGGGVQQYACNGTNAQRFQFVNVANDLYEIRNVNSNKCLDVSGASVSNGAKVQQYSCNGTSAQRWAIQALGNGQYRVMPQTAANKCLDVSGGSASNGAAVQQWTCNGTAAQLFTLALDNTGAQPIPDSTFRITTNTAPGLCLDIDTGNGWDGVNLQQWECNGSDAQRFRFRSRGGNLYEVRASISEKCLDVINAGTYDGANIHQWECNDNSSQIWSVESLGAGRYRFLPQVAVDKCMDVDNSGTSNGTNIQQWECNGSSAQQFSVIAP